MDKPVQHLVLNFNAASGDNLTIQVVGKPERIKFLFLINEITD